MSEESKGLIRANPQEMSSDQRRDESVVQKEGLTQKPPSRGIEGTENNPAVEGLKHRAVEVIQSAIERQRQLIQRVENFYQKKAVAQMKDPNEGMLRGMVSMGIDPDQDIRDLSMHGLNTAVDQIGTYFNSNASGTEGLEGKMDALENYVDARLNASENFVAALERGEDRIQARFKYLKAIDDFGTIWRKFAKGL